MVINCTRPIYMTAKKENLQVIIVERNDNFNSDEVGYVNFMKFTVKH